MSTIASIDDKSFLIGYSGGWTAVTSTAASVYQNTLHSTSQSGASATLFFVGNVASVYGYIPACTSASAGTISVQFSVNGVTSGAASASTTRSCTSTPQANVLFYTTPALSTGVHQLVVTNAGNGPAFLLDRIDTGLNNARTGSTTTTTTATSSGTDTATTLSSSSLSDTSTSSLSTSSIASTSSEFSSTTTSESSTTTTTSEAPSVAVATIGGTLTSLAIAPEPTASGTDIAAPAPAVTSDNSTTSASSASHPVGPIVGGVLGALLVLLILFLLFIRFRRRRRSSQAAGAGPGSPSDEEKAEAVFDIKLPNSSNGPPPSVRFADVGALPRKTSRSLYPSEKAHNQASIVAPKTRSAVSSASTRKAVPPLNVEQSSPASMPPPAPPTPPRRSSGAPIAPFRFSVIDLSPPNPPPSPPPSLPLPPLPPTPSRSSISSVSSSSRRRSRPISNVPIGITGGIGSDVPPIPVYVRDPSRRQSKSSYRKSDLRTSWLAPDEMEMGSSSDSS